MCESRKGGRAVLCLIIYFLGVHTDYFWFNLEDYIAENKDPVDILQTPESHQLVLNLGHIGCIRHWTTPLMSYS